MSNHARCPTCEHQRGPRSTAPLTRGGHQCVTEGPGKCFRAHQQTEAGQPRKAPCACECHTAQADRDRRAADALTGV